MASDETVCRGCGRPLAGRDRFEKLCPTCREAEALRQPVPEPPPDAPEPLECPACGADNAPGTATCTQCGATLRGRPRARLGLLVAIVLLALAAAAAWLLLPRPRSAATPPPAAKAPTPHASAPPPTEPVPPTKPPPPKPVSPELAAAVRQETREFLQFLALGSYERLIDNYVQPDDADFGRVARVWDELVGGAAAPGLAQWGARRIRLGEAAARAELARAGDPDPASTVALLAFLAKEPAASDPRQSSEERARAVLKWHIASLFEGLEPAAAEPGEVAEVRPGELAVALSCRGERRAAWLRAEPVQLVWRRLPVGWVVKLAFAERLERIRDIVKRPWAEGGPAPPGAGGPP